MKIYYRPWMSNPIDTVGDFPAHFFCQIISEYVGIRVFRKFRTKMTKNSQYWQTLVSKAKRSDY